MTDILIAFSGGVNSTYAAYKWASESTDNLKLVYSIESWVDARPLIAGRNDREKANAQKVAEWISANVRTVDFEIRTNPHPYLNWPKSIRKTGGVYWRDWDFGPVKQRHLGHKTLIDDIQPDGFVTGYSVENTSTDSHLYFRPTYDDGTIPIYYAGAGFNPTDGSEENFETLAGQLTGRFEQLEALPNDLKALSFVHCLQVHGKYSCSSCGYHAVIQERPDLGGRELDQMFAKHGSYGAWRSEADPDTYTWRGKPQNKVRELLEVV